MTFTLISKTTATSEIQNAITINSNTKAFMPVFGVNGICEKLTEDNRGYYAMYNSLDVSDFRLIGFEYSGEIYYGLTTSLLWGLIPHESSSKNGGSSCLRFQPYANMKKVLVESNAVYHLCSKSEFIAVKQAFKYNFGETFEKMIFTTFNKSYKPNNIPFYESGDIEVNGVQYNIKFFKGTLTLPKKE